MYRQGYLVYEAEWELKKNKGFAEMFDNAGKKYGMRFSAVLSSDFNVFMRCKKYPDFVLNRTRVDKTGVLCEKLGIPVFHSSFITKIGNDKFLSISHLQKKLPEKVKNTKWVPETFFIPSGNRQLPDKFQGGGDLVLKTVSGHGGEEVILLPKNLPRSCISEKIKKFCQGKNLILQEKIDSESKDLRVYILGGEIYAAVLRRGVNDFRSNFSLGGSAEIYKLSNAECDFIMCFVNAFGGGELAMAGIDFIVDREGRLIFNELEEMAGTRMLYSCSDYDIVKDYVAWLHDIV